jgi:hypothetical protein
MKYNAQKEALLAEREEIRKQLIDFFDNHVISRAQAARDMGMSYQHIINFLAIDGYSMGATALKKVKLFIERHQG